jgi:hypothetical protein
MRLLATLGLCHLLPFITSSVGAQTADSFYVNRNDLLLADQLWRRPFTLPPDMPLERVLLLREAFEKMSIDASFLKATAALNLDIDVLPGVEVQFMRDNLYDIPPELIELACQPVAEVLGIPARTEGPQLQAPILADAGRDRRVVDANHAVFEAIADLHGAREVA